MTEHERPVAHPTRPGTADPPPATTGGPGRLHGLDALRAGALLLGIVLHSLMPFLPGGGWLVTDARTSGSAVVLVGTIHLFRMVLFMMLAGYFGRMVLHRRGPRAYLRDRGLRILLPLVVLGPLTLAALVAVSVLDGIVRGTPPPPLPPGTGDSLAGLLLAAPGHLWFLDVLVQCVVITVGVRAVLNRLAGADRLAAWTGRAGRLLSTPVAGVVVAAVPYLVAVLLQGDAAGGVEQPATIWPEPVPLVGFLGAFLVGWCLHAHPDALTGLARTWPWHLGAAVALSALGSLAGDDLPLVAGAVVVALAGWTWTFGLLGAAARLRQESGAVRYLADASYWMYLLHLPLLLAVEVFLADLDWPILVKLAAAWVTCAVILLLSYDLLVRDTWIGRWLNGRRRASVLRGNRSRVGSRS